MNKWNANLLGELSLYNSGSPVLLCEDHADNTLQLLALLLLCTDQTVSVAQAQEVLFGHEKVDPERVETAFSDMQALLHQQGADNIVLQKPNGFCWNSDAPVTVDVAVFERLYSDFCAPGLPQAQQLETGRNAIQAYKGNLLPFWRDKTWVRLYALRLRQNYITLVTRTCRILLKQETPEGCEEALTLCNRAVLLEPLEEELYWYLFRAMRGLNMKSAVLSYYPVIANLFYDEIGEAPSARMQEIYVWASKESDQMKQDLQHIEQDLLEVTREQRPIRGAYDCQYEMFKQMYHIVARTADRAHNIVTIMLLTLLRGDGGALPKETLPQHMETLHSVLKNMLRKGDIFSRYSSNQYIAMLPMNAASDAVTVETRIRGALSHTPQTAPDSLRVEVQALLPITQT